ncbi:penicillin-insensitive murein endopeptidase [Azospirillum fermentarium]|uniref:penicillin-insensitive murein endopeptidase n=1 Tax=Azospirillum fermentarium TaxID=1233114 RepID=UPI002225CD72|nr:penicillin-insensitive murein endopeptidase [Azospirillum fermentarium]MCW2245934.1 penicillin-insensitive murein endopeptidase [Azospirillum fermentarium]
MRRGLAGLAVMAVALAVASGGPALAETKKPPAKPAAAKVTKAVAKPASKAKPQKAALRKPAAKKHTAKPLPPGSVRLNPVAWSAVAAPSIGLAQSIGGYASGCVAGAVALTPEGTGYQVIRLSRARNYGHPTLVSFLQDFGRRVDQQGLGTALVGDMGQPRGGPLPYGHASHQSGLDADIWLRLDLPPMNRGARESLSEIKYVDYGSMTVIPSWGERQAALIRTAAADPRVARIFVNPAIKRELCTAAGADRGWLRKVRPWNGHDGHMHVRLSCPAGSPECQDQAALPDGDGCGEDLAGWLDRAVPARETPPSKAKPPSPVQPASCAAVLQGPGNRVAQAGAVPAGYRP